MTIYTSLDTYRLTENSMERRESDMLYMPAASVSVSIVRGTDMRTASKLLRRLADEIEMHV